MDKVLEKGVHVRYRITTLKYLNNDFVSSLTLIKILTFFNRVWSEQLMKIGWESLRHPLAEFNPDLIKFDDNFTNDLIIF